MPRASKPNKTSAKASANKPPSQRELAKIRAEFASKPSWAELLATGDYTEPISMGQYLLLVGLVEGLKAARLKAGLSLTAVAERMGIAKGNLSNLENGKADNPTMETLQRYAHALGKRIVCQLVKEK